MVALKTKETDASVKDFLAGIADEQKRRDSEQICKLMEEITREPPKMWGSSIVGFGTFHYKYASGREGDWMTVGFSPRKNALTVYIMAGYNFDPYKDLLTQLGKYKTGKSCLYIDRLSDIDLKVLRKLIAESVKNVKSGKFIL